MKNTKKSVIVWGSRIVREELDQMMTFFDLNNIVDYQAPPAVLPAYGTLIVSLGYPAGLLLDGPSLGLDSHYIEDVMDEIEARKAGFNKVVQNSAPGILKQAADIMEERAKQYDSPGGERSMGRAVIAFNAITGRNLQESEGWLLLQILKDVRDRQRPAAHVDSLHDGVAYSALKAEARLAGL